MYKAIYLQKRKEFWQEEDIVMPFVLINLETNTLVTDFTGFVIKAGIGEGCDADILVDNDAIGGVTISGEKFEVHFEREDVGLLCKGIQKLEIEIEKDNKHFTVYRDKVIIREEFID